MFPLTIATLALILIFFPNAGTDVGKYDETNW